MSQLLSDIPYRYFRAPLDALKGEPIIQSFLLQNDDEMVFFTLHFLLTELIILYQDLYLSVSCIWRESSYSLSFH